MVNRVERVLAEIRPAIQDDGGDVELVGVSAEGRVTLRFKGACTACPSRDMTLQHGIERTLRELVPEVTAVVADR
ncbi:MAG: NifU family protein [Phycisphaerae bacterium]|nr:NifU family protein [Phycisphaerae bacterium]